ncbi:MAG: hypothetical protein HDT28_03450 [Clostridiales bacterium]|nr:hypothetical protein [Clostridiales bacterium]
MALHRIESVNIRGVFGDKWLLRLQKKAFGWVYYGTETEDNPYIDANSSGKVELKHKYVDWLEFRRKSPFTGNFLFKLTEVLCNIISFFRRLFCSFIIPAIVICLILAAVLEMDQLYNVATYVAIAYFGGLFAPTLILSLLGVLWRKVFKIDKRLKASLLADGYSDDLTDCTMKGE